MRTWLDAIGAAFIGFLAVLCVGAALIIAVKLDLPVLGRGSGPVAALIAIVIAGLGVLRVPIHVAGVSLTALPLGALAAAAFGVSWAIEAAVRRSAAQGLRAQMVEGMKSAVPFALVCWVAALAFRFRTGGTPVSASAGAALGLGLVWGALFGALGGVLAHGTLRDAARMGARALRARSIDAYEGALAGLVMLATVGVLAAFVVLLWIIVGLARGGPAGFGARDAAAAIVYLAAFAPNVIVAIVSVSLGAPLSIGAQVGAGGRLIGPLQHFSLGHWGHAGAPWYSFGVVLIPIGACLLGGFAARRNADDPRRVARVIGVAAGIFGAVLGLLAWIGDARLGAGLVRARGFGEVAPVAWEVLLLGVAWAGVLGFAGWKVAELGSGPAPEASNERRRMGDAP